MLVILKHFWLCSFLYRARPPRQALSQGGIFVTPKIPSSLDARAGAVARGGKDASCCLRDPPESGCGVDFLNQAFMAKLTQQALEVAGGNA